MKRYCYALHCVCQAWRTKSLRCSLILLSLSLGMGFSPGSSFAQNRPDLQDVPIHTLPAASDGEDEHFSRKLLNRRNLPEDQPIVIPSDRGKPFSAAQVQGMIRELTTLIDKYEYLLASAGVFGKDMDQNTLDLIQSLNQKEPTASAETGSAEAQSKIEISADFVSTYKILNQAKQGLRDFMGFLEQRDYIAAGQVWVKSKNLLVDHFPTHQQLMAPNIRGIWLDRGTIVKAQSKQDLVPLFNRMERAGINVVFFETLNAGYPIYPSKIAPTQNPLVEDWDPLKAAVELAHERGMELHAWVWVFSTANQRHNEILGLPKEFPGPVLDQHPDWAIRDQSGSLYEKSSGKVFLDPANPEVQDYLSDLFKEIVTQYDVDGLQLDYIRYPFQQPRIGNIHGYSAIARRKFQKKYRIDPIKLTPKHRLWSAWLAFKGEQVDRFVEQISAKLKAKRPELIISAAVFPMASSIRRSTLHQNWEGWVKQGWVDLLVPMTYAANTPELQEMTEPLFLPNSQGASLLVPGLRLRNMPSYRTVDQVQYLQNSLTHGYALFAAAYFQSSLASGLNRPYLRQKLSPAAKLLPHRQPFQSALTEYQFLRRAWNYWISKQTFSSEEKAFKIMGKAVDQLDQSLIALSEDPAPSKWNEAMTQLELIQTQLQDWTTGTQAPSANQVEAWQFRLQRIQVLLNYGRKTILKQNHFSEDKTSAETDG